MSMVIGTGWVRGAVEVNEGVLVVVGPSRGTAGGKGGGRLFWVIRRIREGWGTMGVVGVDASGGGDEGERGGRLVRGKRRIRDSRDSEEGAKDCRRSCSILAPLHRWRWACRRVLAKIVVWRRVGAWAWSKSNEEESRLDSQNR